MAKYVPGSYALEKLDLEFAKGVLNCKDRFVEITIEESVMVPSVSLSLVLLDAADIYNKIDFDGTETIAIKYYTHTQREVELKFQIYKDQVIADPGSGSNKLIKLFGVTPEHYASERSDVNISFEGKISDFVEKVFTKLNTERNLERHSTAGNVISIVPGMTVFEALSYLASKSYSSQHKSSLFRFYETVDGYHFKNLEQLIAEGKKEPITYVYSATGNTTSNDEEEQFLISSLTFQTNKDIMKKLKSGMYASVTNEIDIINQSVISTPFLGKEAFLELAHLDNEAMSLDSVKMIEENLGFINTSFWITRAIDNTNRENNYSNITGRKLFYQTSLEQITATAVVPGNSDMSIGKVINLDMAEQTPETDVKEQEGKVSGNYLVLGVVNQITRDNMSTLLKLNKESYRANIPDPSKNVVVTESPNA